MTENIEKTLASKGKIKAEKICSRGISFNGPSFAWQKKEVFVESEKYKKNTFLHRMRTLGILIFLAIFTGSGLGVWYYNTNLRSTTDFDGLFAVADEYVADSSATFAKLEIESPTDKSWVVQAHANSQSPASLSALDNFILADWNASHSSTFSAIGTGKVNTSMGIGQDVRSEKNYDGRAYTFASISSGLIPVVSLDYHQKNSTTTSLYDGKSTKDGIDWKFSKTMQYNDYRFYIGTLLTNVHPYIVSEKTYVSSSEVSFDEETGNYTFTLELDKTLSVIRYVRQVKKTGGLATYPEFSSVILDVTIDEDWNFVTIDAKEVYSAVKGIRVSCDARLIYNYTFDEEITLPVNK